MANALWKPVSPDLSELPDQKVPQPPPFSLDGNSGFGSHYPTALPYQEYQQDYQQQISPHSYYPAQNQPYGIKQEQQQAWQPFQPDTKHHPADVTPAAPPAVASKPKLDTRGVEVKTKFPTARIKRIMQADEDVGKVAQVTPVAMAKALELFMIQIITASSDVAKARGSKRVQTAHMKTVVSQDEQFDFLRPIVAKVPDAPAKKSGAADSDDSDGDGPKKRKKSIAGGRGKKRRGSDDE